MWVSSVADWAKLRTIDLRIEVLCDRTIGWGFTNVSYCTSGERVRV